MEKDELEALNVIIEGSKNEASDKGGYLQVLHSPNITQTVQGVQFINMGRSGEYDHFVSSLNRNASILESVVELQLNFVLLFDLHI